MARRSSQAPGTRPSVSGTRFPSARVAIRVAKADLTTVGSSDDTRDICDLCDGPFAPCHRLFRLCSFSRFVGLCFALTFFHTQRIFVLGTAISNVRLPSPNSLTHPICTPPRKSDSHDTDTYYTIHTTHASILLCIYKFILLYHRLITRRLDLCSILCFPFVPFVLP